MNYKNTGMKILSWLLAVILIVIATYCLASEYIDNNPEVNNKKIIDTKYTKDGYLILDNSNNDIEVVNVDEIIKNDDNTYSFKGIKLKRYTITENEYDYLKNQEPLEIDGVNYYFTWSDEHNEYIFVSKENDNIYYLKKDNVSNEYMVLNLSNSNEPYEETEDKVQITVKKYTKYNNETVEKAFEKMKKGKYKFEYKNGSCNSVENVSK